MDNWSEPRKMVFRLLWCLVHSIACGTICLLWKFCYCNICSFWKDHSNWFALSCCTEHTSVVSFPYSFNVLFIFCRCSFCIRLGRFEFIKGIVYNQALFKVSYAIGSIQKYIYNFNAKNCSSGCTDFQSDRDLLLRFPPQRYCAIRNNNILYCSRT